MSQRWALGEVTFLAAREALGSRSGATAQAKDGRPRPPAATAAGLQREELQFLRGCDSYRAREESQVAARQLGLRFLQACKRQSSRCLAHFRIRNRDARRRRETNHDKSLDHRGQARPSARPSAGHRGAWPPAIGAAIQARPSRRGHRRGQARPSARPPAWRGHRRAPRFFALCVCVCVRAEAERLCPSAASSSLVGWAGQSAPFVPTPSQ